MLITHQSPDRTLRIATDGVRPLFFRGCGAVRRTRCPPVSHQGFTLVEVLVALAIVAIALMAGLQATTALTRNACGSPTSCLRSRRERTGQGPARARCPAWRQQPDLRAGRAPAAGGDHRAAYTQPESFRRIDAQVLDGDNSILRLSTIIGRY